MRAALTLSLVLALAAPAAAQTAPSPAPAPSAGSSPPPAACDPQTVALGAAGRALRVAFTGAVFGDRVCATVANLDPESVAAAVAATPAPDALVEASLGSGSGAALTVGPSRIALAAPGAPGALAAGPFLIAPGGALGDVGGDSEPQRRVVVAFAGDRIVVAGTTPVALPDLARALREHPDLFGVESVERAAVIASGANAVIAIRTGSGELLSGDGEPAGQVLELTRR